MSDRVGILCKQGWPRYTYIIIVCTPEFSYDDRMKNRTNCMSVGCMVGVNAAVSGSWSALAIEEANAIGN